MNIKNNLKKLSLQFILFLLIVISGVIYIRYTWIKIKNEQSENVLQIARSIEACLPKDDIRALDANAGDIDKPAYQHLKNILKEIIHVNTNARFAYLYTHKNAKLYFLADSEPENSKDYSPPGQEYTEAKAEDKQPFIDGKELITIPLSDRWGNWVSAFIPIKDEASGKIIAVFGLDFNARTWNKTLYYEIIQSSGLVVLLLMLLLFSLRIKAKNLSLKNENTERRQAEKALLESENQKAAILKAIPDLLFVFNYKGDYLDVYSEDDSKLFIPRQALIGKNISELFPPEVAKEAIEAFKKSLELKELVQFSYSVQINTKLEYFEARIVPASDYEVLAIVRDITDRKNAEQEISYSQERARQQRNVLAEIALDEVISSCNLKPAFQKLTEEISAAIQVERASIWLFSDDRSALHCISLYESKTRQHSDGAILYCADYPKYFEAIYQDSRINANDAINDSRTNEFAANYLLPLGISSMLDAGIYLEGALVGVVCLEHCGEKRNWFADEESFASTIASIVAQTMAINKRKQSDSMLQDIITKNPMSIQIVDIQGYTLQVNAAYTALFGSIPPPGYSVFDDFQLNQQEFGNLLLRVRNAEVVRFPDFYYNAHEINSEFPDVPIWIQMVVFPLNDSLGKPKQFVLIHENITARKLAEQELIKAKLQAEESDRLKTAFLNNISHEIRTPFNGLLGFLSMLQSDKLSKDERDEYISFINNNAHRLMQTINDIVEISMIQTGQLQPAIAECNIKSLTYELFGLYKHEAQSKGLKFKINSCLPKEIESIKTDAQKLNSILSVLLGNAIKFTKEGSIELKIHKIDDSLEFSVKDTGIGIPANKQQEIFERFMQADVSVTRNFEGSGLGLSIAKAYVEMLGGSIGVESNDKGSRFYFKIGIGN